MLQITENGEFTVTFKNGWTVKTQPNDLRGLRAKLEAFHQESAQRYHFGPNRLAMVDGADATVFSQIVVFISGAYKNDQGWAAVSPTGREVSIPTQPDSLLAQANERAERPPLRLVERPHLDMVDLPESVKTPGLPDSERFTMLEID